MQRLVISTLLLCTVVGALAVLEDDMADLTPLPLTDLSSSLPRFRSNYLTTAKSKEDQAVADLDQSLTALKTALTSEEPKSAKPSDDDGDAGSSAADPNNVPCVDCQASASDITRIVESFRALDVEEERIQREKAKQAEQAVVKKAELKDPSNTQYRQEMDKKVLRAKKLRALAEALLADAQRKLAAANERTQLLQCEGLKGIKTALDVTGQLTKDVADQMRIRAIECGFGDNFIPSNSQSSVSVDGSGQVRPDAAAALRFVETQLPPDQSSRIVAAPVRFRQIVDEDEA